MITCHNESPHRLPSQPPILNHLNQRSPPLREEENSCLTVALHRRPRHTANQGGVRGGGGPVRLRDRLWRGLRHARRHLLPPATLGNASPILRPTTVSPYDRWYNARSWS